MLAPQLDGKASKESNVRSDTTHVSFDVAACVVQLALELRTRAPQLKLLLTSGFAEMSHASDMAGLAGLPILHKPYRKDDLAACLEKMFS